MLFTAPGSRDASAGPAGHVGYLAGRYRNGAYSDLWTDVSRCAEGTFVGYAPACSCGWRGRAVPAGPAGRLSGRRQWWLEHLEHAPVEAFETSRAPRRP